MANNHILNYRNEGLAETIASLKKADIDFVGAGNNFSEACKSYSFEKDGIKIAIINITENECPTTFDGNSGSNPLDTIESVKQIRDAKASNDKVICIIHGGHEYCQVRGCRSNIVFTWTAVLMQLYAPTHTA